METETRTDGAELFSQLDYCPTRWKPGLRYVTIRINPAPRKAREVETWTTTMEKGGSGG